MPKCPSCEDHLECGHCAAPASEECVLEEHYLECHSCGWTPE